MPSTLICVPCRRGSTAIVRRLIVAVAATIVAFGLLERAMNRPVVRIAGGVVTPGDTAATMPGKPSPVSSGFQGCPPFGDGGDRQLNFLKNRVDSADWVPTPFVTVVDLAWPTSVVRRMRDSWSRRD